MSYHFGSRCQVHSRIMSSDWSVYVSDNEFQFLYRHIPHWHTPRNVNEVHKAKQQAAGFNQRLAVALTKSVGSMWTAYIFTALAFVGLFGLLGWLNPFTFLLATWLSQQFLQLVFLPVLAVGQSVLSKHQELQADEMFATTQKSFHDVEEIMKHLDAQDKVILEILRRMTGAPSPQPYEYTDNEGLTHTREGKR